MWWLSPNILPPHTASPWLHKHTMYTELVSELYPLVYYSPKNDEKKHTTLSHTRGQCVTSTEKNMLWKIKELMKKDMEKNMNRKKTFFSTIKSVCSSEKGLRCGHAEENNFYSGHQPLSSYLWTLNSSTQLFRDSSLHEKRNQHHICTTRDEKKNFHRNHNEGSLNKIWTLVPLDFGQMRSRVELLTSEHENLKHLILPQQQSEKAPEQLLNISKFNSAACFSSLLAI